MSTSLNTPSPSLLPVEITAAAAAAGTIGQAILNASGNSKEEAIAATIPMFESLIATAIQGFTAASGSAPTVAQLQALLGQDVSLDPAPSS